jgi:hypothetical protein
MRYGSICTDLPVDASQLSVQPYQLMLYAVICTALPVDALRCYLYSLTSWCFMLLSVQPYQLMLYAVICTDLPVDALRCYLDSLTSWCFTLLSVQTYQLMLYAVIWTDECHIFLAGNSLVTTQGRKLSTTTITHCDVDLGAWDTAIITFYWDQFGHSCTIQRFHCNETIYMDSQKHFLYIHIYKNRVVFKPTSISNTTLLLTLCICSHLIRYFHLQLNCMNFNLKPTVWNYRRISQVYILIKSNYASLERWKFSIRKGKCLYFLLKNIHKTLNLLQTFNKPNSINSKIKSENCWKTNCSCVEYNLCLKKWTYSILTLKV